MREIYIDLSEETGVNQYRFAGYEGEHNETNLIFKLPERMRVNPGATFRFVFETAKGEAIFSRALTLSDEGAVSVLLVRELMIPPQIKVMVGCYVTEGGETTLVAKTGEVILGVQKSIAEDQRELDINGGCVPGLVIDSSLTPDSTNPVEGRVIAAELEKKVDRACLVEKIEPVSAASGEKVATELAVARAVDGVMKREEYKIDSSFSAESSCPVENRIISEGVCGALKGKKSGNPLSLLDQSSLPHRIRVGVQREDEYLDSAPNYLPYPFEEKSKTENGLTFTDDGWGWITVSGTATKDTVFSLIDFASSQWHLNHEKYILCGCPQGGGEETFYLTDFSGAVDTGRGALYQTKENSHFGIVIKQGATLSDVIFKPALFLPASVKVVGKNIFDGLLKPWRGSSNRFQNKNPLRVKKNTNYTISVVGAKSQPYFGIYTSTDESITTDDVNIATNVFTFNSGNNEEVYFRPWAENWYYGIDFNSKVQVEEGVESTEYEPYREEVIWEVEGGVMEEIASTSSPMTLMAESGLTVSAEYNRDITKALEEIVAKLA